MLTIFIRESLWIGTDSDRFHAIRNRLYDAGIAYRYKVHNRMGGSDGRGGSMRGRTGSFGIRTDAMYQYEIFVHRKEYARARQIMQ